MTSGFIIAFLLRDFGVVGVFLGVTVCMLVVVLAIGMFGPRTNGLRLEDISH
jgi:putative MFS transporter